MWLFAKDGFLSVVQHNESADVLVVRSRFQNDIQKLVGVKPFATPSGDYPVRAHVDREAFRDAIVSQIKLIDYDKFKPSVTDKRRHRAYFEIWDTLWQLQEQLAPKGLGFR
jgi:hypothetical protein